MSDPAPPEVPSAPAPPAAPVPSVSSVEDADRWVLALNDSLETLAVLLGS